MSIKPVACADNGTLNWYADSQINEQIDLYAIPDNYRLVPVQLLARAVWMLQPGLPVEEELRAIIEEKP